MHISGGACRAPFRERARKKIKRYTNKGEKTFGRQFAEIFFSSALGQRDGRRQTERRPQADRETAGGQSEMGRMIDGR